MREIKFRAYDKKYAIMLYSDSSSLTYIIALSKKDDLTLQQYTGLKDKNGVEIYEGDILRWHKDNNLSEVIFNNGSFSVKGINWTAYWYLGDYNDAYQVIGNIFENPELLES